MSTDAQLDSVADETESLLGNETRDHRPRRQFRNVEHSVWVQCSLYASQTAKAALHSNKIYALFVFFPLGVIAYAFAWPSVTITTFNLLAIIPLSALLSYSSDELSDAVGELIGGLINATFGNAVELVVGILALVHGEISFVQSVMLGSILSDILLVLGCCLVSAAFDKQLPTFNEAMADTLSSLMIVTATALILPTALYSTFSSSEANDFASKISAFSRSSAVVLIALYLVYLYFQLGTHPETFLSPPEDRDNTNEEGSGAEEEQEAPLNIYAAIAILITSTLGIVFCTHLLLDSADQTAHDTHITKTFIGAILVPIASNAPEAATIIAVSRSCKVNFGIGVIVNSILQIALFVIPLLVIIGWIVGQPMTLYFETFQTTMLFLAVVVVNRLLQDGKYTYIQGAMLVALYAVIATAFYIRPEVTADAVYRLTS